MAIALTVYPNDLAASATLSTANVLIGNATINAGGAGHGSTVGTALGFDECFSQGKGAAWAAGSVNTSIAPTGHGWFLDASTLDGLDIVAGNWTAAWSLNVTANTATVDLYTRVFTYLSGTYTQIGYILQSGAALTSALTTYTSGATALSAIHFATGTKLYIDLWANVTASTMIAGSVINVRQSNLAGDGLSTCNTITPGYVLALSTSMTASGVLSVTMGYATALASTDSGVGTLAGTLSATGSGVALTGTCAGSSATTGTFSLATALTSTLPGASTITASLAMLILASDTFVRANQANWGQSSGVGSWVKGNGTSTASIASNKGNLTGATNVTTEYIGTTSAADVDERVRFVQSAATAACGLITRGVVASSNYYAAWLKNGSLTINSVAAGTFTAFATTAFSATAGSAYWIRYRLTGSTHMVKVWADGSVEPAAWQLTATDSTYSAAGQFGIVAQQALAGDSVQFDQFTAYLAGWASALPAPIYYGAYEPPAYTSTAGIATFESLTGTTMSLVHGYCQWGAGTSTFSTTWANTIRTHGSIPMLTWEPWDLVGPTNATYTLANITAGNFDTYITTFANAIKAWGFPLFLRFAHEMNGVAWYPWQEGSNGNSVGQYVLMWKHVHDIFTAQGVTNVTWVWCPNDEGGGSYPITGLYPGDAYVDWTGIDGYNASGGQTFGQIYTPIYNDLVALTTKPIMIAEFGTEEEAAGVKGSWYYDMLRVQLPYFFPKIRAIAVFDSTYGTHTTIPINSSTDATNQFIGGATSGYYVGNTQGSIATTPIPPFSVSQALSLYGTSVAASLPTAGKSATTTGGVEVAAVTTAPASGSGYVECFALGGISTVNAALLAPSGKGWILDLPVLENQRLVAGPWGASVAVSNANGGGPVNSYTIRFWQHSSGGAYAAIGSLVLSASQVISTLRVVKAFLAATMPQTDFAVGDKLYIDFFIDANGWASDVLSVYVSSSGAAGVAGDLEVNTAGYTPSGASGVVTSYIPRALSALLVVTSTALATTTAGSGTLAGTFSLSAALVQTLAGNGTLAPSLSANETLSGGTLAATGTLAGTFSLSTSLPTTQLTGAGQLTGSGQLTTALAGTLACAGSLTSAFTLSTALVKTTAGVGVLTPTLGTAFTLPGVTTPGIGTLTGALTLGTALGATLSGAGQVVGTLQAASAVAFTLTLSGAGTLATALSAAETLSAPVLIGGTTLIAALSASLPLPSVTTAGAGTLSAGAFQFTTALVTTTTGVGALSAALTAAETLSGGTCTGSGTLSGALAMRTQLSAVLSGIGISPSALTASFALGNASLAGVGTLAGTENLTTALTDSFIGTSNFAGSLTLRTALSITLAATGALAGAISGGGALTVVGAGVGTVTGSLAAALSMSGTTVGGTSTLTGTLTVKVALTSTLVGIGSSTATPSLGALWSATLAGMGALSGTSVLATYLLVLVPGTSSLGATVTRTAWLSVVYTGNTQLSAALILGGGQLSMCLLAGHSTLAAVFSYPGKSATATWKTRDHSATWQTRDLAAIWKTRDLEDTWKEER